MTTSTASELAYLSRALKAPRVREVAGRLAERARDEGWDHETYLAAVLAEEVSDRDSHGGEAGVKSERLTAVKTIDDFDFTAQPSVKRTTIAHLAQLDFLAEAVNVVFLGPPGTGKTHLSVVVPAYNEAERILRAKRERPRRSIRRADRRRPCDRPRPPAYRPRILSGSSTLPCPRLGRARRAWQVYSAAQGIRGARAPPGGAIEAEISRAGDDLVVVLREHRGGQPQKGQGENEYSFAHFGCSV